MLNSNLSSNGESRLLSELRAHTDTECTSTSVGAKALIPKGCKSRREARIFGWLVKVEIYEAVLEAHRRSARRALVDRKSSQRNLPENE